MRKIDVSLWDAYPRFRAVMRLDPPSSVKFARSMSTNPASLSHSRCSCSVWAAPSSNRLMARRLNPTLDGGDTRESSRIWFTIYIEPSGTIAPVPGKTPGSSSTVTLPGTGATYPKRTRRKTSFHYLAGSVFSPLTPPMLVSESGLLPRRTGQQQHYCCPRNTEHRYFCTTPRSPATCRARRRGVPRPSHCRGLGRRTRRGQGGKRAFTISQAPYSLRLHHQCW